MVTRIPEKHDWLLLVYSVPRLPSAARVYVWRKLRQLGAEALQDATWVLPASPRTQEHFRWLASEIRELKGRVTLWEARLGAAAEEAELRRRFETPLEAGYRRLLTDARRPAARGAALAARFQQLMSRDYFGHPLGPRVRAALERLQRRAR